MTIVEAAKILGRHRHEGKSHWIVAGGGSEELIVSNAAQCGGIDYTEFEAVAIAEKYERHTVGGVFAWEPEPAPYEEILALFDLPGKP